jgi:hypothetical protein
MPHYKDLQNKLHWLDSTEHESYLPAGSVQITEAEFATMHAEYEASLEAAKTYAQKRAAEYPSFADQFDLLYHGGIDAWKASIQTVKDRYPKT